MYVHGCLYSFPSGLSSRISARNIELLASLAPHQLEPRSHDRLEWWPAIVWVFRGETVELLKVQDAARELGISYPTLKQWIYHRKIKSVRTAGGHHRIPRTEIDRLAFFGKARRSTKKPLPAMSPPKALEHFISGRNQLIGRVTKVKIVGLLAKVVLDIGGQNITSIITSEACRDLNLKKGQPAAALIKATEVMIIASGPPNF